MDSKVFENPSFLPEHHRVFESCGNTCPFPIQMTRSPFTKVFTRTRKFIARRPGVLRERIMPHRIQPGL